ncbi:mitochondrial ribosomal protein [Pseudovirgaria hyperparasitica]|uniref:37S ribosomal protein S25, mitochondrial n=1 Tax=Pseudovirgaria hyperparasitica TaxID=470096 RepID=A0A6A6WCY3_9PEZI|nr:mitochondrial ribosomal protein [Pseudovirgaria hyperparasitica]KAF2759820.1 mitochondrial ribosomal protein [Pseudovirgaria hyperparasitica]
MGRYNFTAQRVHRAAQALLDQERLHAAPAWHEVVYTVPPPEILTRTVQQIRAPPHGRRKKRNAKMFMPPELKYPEDELRSEFFHDHPWELARPKIVVEDSGNSAKGYDWSKITQDGKKLDGESVVQRQAWLMRHERLEKAVAYDKARKEFYKIRNVEDIARRIAKEEAMAYGAYFGKGPLEIGMELENKAWDNWRQWAAEQIKLAQYGKAASGSIDSGPTTSEYSKDMIDEEDPDQLPESLAISEG